MNRLHWITWHHWIVWLCHWFQCSRKIQWSYLSLFWIKFIGDLMDPMELIKPLDQMEPMESLEVCPPNSDVKNRRTISSIGGANGSFWILPLTSNGRRQCTQLHPLSMILQPCNRDFYLVGLSPGVWGGGIFLDINTEKQPLITLKLAQKYILYFEL